MQGRSQPFHVKGFRELMSDNRIILQGDRCFMESEKVLKSFNRSQLSPNFKGEPLLWKIWGGSGHPGTPPGYGPGNYRIYSPIRHIIEINKWETGGWGLSYYANIKMDRDESTSGADSESSLWGRIHLCKRAPRFQPGWCQTGGWAK